jgi:hypothetical protein
MLELGQAADLEIQHKLCEVELIEEPLSKSCRAEHVIMSHSFVFVCDSRH